MKSWIKIAFIALAIGLQACGANRTVLQNKLPKINDEQLFSALDSISKSVPTFISTKIDTKYSDNKQNQSFKTSLKIDKGNTVHALISFAGLPIITAKISTDTVKISNKKDKCFIIEDLNFFKQQFGIDFTYSNLEELLLGRPLNYNSEKKYYRINDPYHYIVATQKKLENDGKILIAYYLSPDLKHLKKVEINSYADHTTIEINYPEYYVDTQFAAPKIVEAEIKTAKNKINLSLSYEKMEINVPKDIIIVIPDSYVNCK